MAEVWENDELLDYGYPFLFPDVFQQKLYIPFFIKFLYFDVFLLSKSKLVFLDIKI